VKNFRIYVRISGPNSNFGTFQDKFQNFRNFRTTPRPVNGLSRLTTTSNGAGTADSIEKYPYSKQWMMVGFQAFASRYCRCNADQVSRFESADTVFLVAFAVIMLNTDLHNANIKPERKMKLVDFIRNLRGLSSASDFSTTAATAITTIILL